MKFYCKCLLFVILIFLFWQILLILITIREIFDKIEFNSCDINLLNKKTSTIPRIIHQMWKNENLLTYPINNSQSSWKHFYPNYEIKLWTDEDLENLLLKSEYKYLYSIYNSYSYSIQRADLGRLIILHFEGGIYVDLDVFPSELKQIENLRLLNVSLLIPRSSTGSSLINHFLIAQKSSHILDYILHEFVSIKFYQTIYILPYLQVFSTGSFFLTHVIKKYLEKTNNSNSSLWILSENDLIDYINHHQGRSWHLFDGFILNLIGDQNYKLFIIFFLTFLLSTFFIFKLKNFLLQLYQIRMKNFIEKRNSFFL